MLAKRHAVQTDTLLAAMVLRTLLRDDPMSMATEFEIEDDRRS